MSSDIIRPPACTRMTLAFNALYVGVSRHFPAGIEKVQLLAYTFNEEKQLELTTPISTPPSNEEKFFQNQPYELQMLIEQPSQIISELASTLLELHRDACPHTVVLENGDIISNKRLNGQCWGCARLAADLEAKDHINKEAAFTDADCFTSESVECSDCGGLACLWIEDTSTRLEGHCGCWADCPSCGTITGAECDCFTDCEGCGEPMPLDREFSSWCCAECAQPSDFMNPNPAQTEWFIEQAKVETLVCCDYHSDELSLEELPCAAYQGTENGRPYYAPNFEVCAGDFDAENDLFKSHILHLVGAITTPTLASLVLGWDYLNCPACNNPVEVTTEGDGIEVSCEDCSVGCVL